MKHKNGKYIVVLPMKKWGIGVGDTPSEALSKAERQHKKQCIIDKKIEKEMRLLSEKILSLTQEHEQSKNS